MSIRTGGVREMKIAVCFIGALAAIAAATVTFPAIAGDAGNGKKLAERWCQSCHAIAANQPMAVTEAPPFATIARKPGFDEAKVATFLLDPHPKMPDIGLSRDSAADLAAFIASQK
jgi:mono/diheme cytochrome c family protein